LKANATVNIGVAAHITAASPGSKENPGPRYDESLTAQQRGDMANGIWLCQNCAKLIDSDVQRYPADLLRRWKVEAEARAFEAIATSASATSNHFVVVAELDDADR